MFSPIDRSKSSVTEVQVQRDLLVRFLAWLEAGAVIANSSEQLADDFLADDAAGAALVDIVDGPEVDLGDGGVPVAVRGACRVSRFLTDTGANGATRRFTILRTPKGDHVMLLGPWRPSST